MSKFNVGDKVQWGEVDKRVWQVLRLHETHAEVWAPDNGVSLVHMTPLGELTLLESAAVEPRTVITGFDGQPLYGPQQAPSLLEKSFRQCESLLAENEQLRLNLASCERALASWKEQTRLDVTRLVELNTENARLREALQMAVDTTSRQPWAHERLVLAAAAALGIRPKETP